MQLQLRHFRIEGCWALGPGGLRILAWRFQISEEHPDCPSASHCQFRLVRSTPAALKKTQCKKSERTTADEESIAAAGKRNLTTPKPVGAMT